MASRLGRFEEKREKRRIVIALSGTLAVLAFVGFFGLKFLEGFSLFLDKLRGNSPQIQTQPELILPPVLDEPMGATNSATVALSGRGEPDFTFILFINEREFKRVPVPKDGNVFINGVSLDEGENTISAKLTDEKGNLSNLSNVITITLKKGNPNLEITAPADGTTIFGDKNTVTVSGKTDPDNQVTINDRFVVIRINGSFDYPLVLNEGENVIKVVATDRAGNQTTQERKVTYQR